MSSNGLAEFGPTIRAIIEAADRAGFLGSVEIDAWVVERSQELAAARDAAVADALDAQATFYWEASTLMDPAKEVAERQGEETMSAILDAQIRTMREVSNRLRRRAAEWRGLPAEDKAIHEMAAGGAAPAPAPPVGPVGSMVNPSLTAVIGEITRAYLVLHPELDLTRHMVSFDYRDGGEEGLGWYVAGHILIEHPPGLPVAPPAPPDCDCACCLVGDGLCYCEGPKTKMCKCVPCVKARKDMK